MCFHLVPVDGCVIVEHGTHFPIVRCSGSGSVISLDCCA